LEIEATFLPNWKVGIEKNDVTVTLENPWRQRLTGVVEIISPMETWPQALVANYSFLEMQPRLLHFDLQPAETKQLRFRSNRVLKQSGARDEDLWLVVKLMCNGHVDYLPVMGLIR